MATMKEVAEIAGVSSATVSHVVNGTKKISPGTTERVLMAIRQANYSPNTLAKSLRSGKTKTIGVLVEDIRGLPVANIVCGIGETIALGGYRMLLFDLHLLEKLYNRYEQILAYRDRINEGMSLLFSAHVDGVIYVGMHDRHVDGLIDVMDTPLVFAYSHGAREDTYVTYSNLESAMELTRHLIARGHKRIAVIAGHPHSYPTMQRLRGYQMAMRENNLTIPNDYVLFGDWEYASGMEKTAELLRHPDRPTAIFAMNDLMAAGCLNSLKENGIAVPNDMAVVGFDNREIAQYVQPALTTVALPTKEIGNIAASRLLSLIAGETCAQRHVILPCSIIERQSV